MVKLDLVVGNYGAAVSANLSISTDYLQHDAAWYSASDAAIFLGFGEWLRHKEDGTNVAEYSATKFVRAELADPLPSAR